MKVAFVPRNRFSRGETRSIDHDVQVSRAGIDAGIGRLHVEVLGAHRDFHRTGHLGAFGRAGEVDSRSGRTRGRRRGASGKRQERQNQ